MPIRIVSLHSVTARLATRLFLCRKKDKERQKIEKSIYKIKDERKSSTRKDASGVFCCIEWLVECSFEFNSFVWASLFGRMIDTFIIALPFIAS